MADGHVDWRVRSPFGDVDIEIYPGAIDAAARDISMRELLRLLYDFKNRHPEVRRALLAVHARLRGLSTADLGRDPFDRDTGSSRAEAISAELLFQARAGNLVLRRTERRAVAVQVDVVEEEPALGPETVVETDWIQFEVLDQETSAPIAGLKLAATMPDGSKATMTSAADGTTPVKQTVPGICSVQLDATNLGTLGYPASSDPPPLMTFPTGKVNKILLLQQKLQLTHLYHDDRPVHGADFTVILTNGQQVKGTLDDNGEATVVVSAPGAKVQFGPDVRPWERVDQTKNPDFQADLDADGFVASRFASDAGAS
jgi:hypothetical protein